MINTKLSKATYLKKTTTNNLIRNDSSLITCTISILTDAYCHNLKKNKFVFILT